MRQATMESIRTLLRGISSLPCWRDSRTFGIFLFYTCLFCSNPVIRAGRSFSPVDDVTGDTGALLRMIADSNSGRIYLGAVNRLYQLNEDLYLEAVVETGPKEDNPMCPPPSSECQCMGPSCKDYEKRPMDSYSKVLVIDYRGNRLIACSNLYQGHCDKHLLDNITRTDEPVWTMLVPNDISSSVVMFIGPGQPNPASTHILYVAATRSTQGLPAYKDIVPAVCMRNLHDFDLVSDSILTPSRIEIEVQQRDLFRVDYVHGFSSLGFSYFLTVQKVSAISDSDKYVTQIFRVCWNDQWLYSYTEIPLECNSGGVQYNILRAAAVTHPGTELAKSLGLPHIEPMSDAEHILVGVFSKQAAKSRAGSAESALCVYPLRDVRRKFTETIQRCFQGIGNTGPDHFVQPKACLRTPFEIGDDYCGQHDINHPIKGTEPISREAVVSWSDVNATSLAVTVTGDLTVAFIGTQTGRLHKVTISSGEEAVEYDSQLIEAGAPILKDMTFDRSRNNIYVMTERRVRKISVENCSRYKTCGDCLGARDPYCGWCALDRKCSKRSDCSGSVNDGVSRWLPYHTGICPRIISMPSNQAQKHTSTRVIMTVESLPMSRGGNYQCAFSGYGVTRVTSVLPFDQDTRSNNTLNCETPRANLLPAFPTGKDHIVMTLSLMLNEQDFLSTNFTFFDCSVHNTCTKCTTSGFPCWWCVKKHQCSNNREQCNSDVLITGQRVQGRSDTPGPEFCPRLENIVNSSEILIPSGTTRSLKVKASHLQAFQNNFKCIFNFKRDEEKDARITEDHGSKYIECDPVLFEYVGSSHYINVPFHIVWDNGRESRQTALDNPLNVQVQVYKCEEMASNCGRCRITDSRHGCGWCTGTNLCTVREQCAVVPWRQRQHSCTDPSISSIIPNTGPMEGGTELTIAGENLGISAADTSVTVAGIPCNILSYDPSIRLTCKTGPSGGSAHSGPVLVRIVNEFSASSSEQYTYINPEIRSITPRYGPVSGGTAVTLTGKNLDAGTSVTLHMLSANGSLTTSCEFIHRSTNSAVCITSNSSGPYEVSSIVMNVDRSSMPYKARGMFQILPDPVIESVSPDRSVFSGGRRIVVEGQRLEIISNPRMIVYLGDIAQNVTGMCDHDDGRLICYTPNLSTATVAMAQPAEEEPYVLSYGFLFDSVESLRIISPNNRRLRRASSPVNIPEYFQYFPDPIFDEFEGGMKKFYFTKNVYLTINGKYVNLALKEKDVRVTLEDIDCTVTSVSSTQVLCLPLEEQLQKIPNIAAVRVHVGNGTTYHIGSLQIDETSNLFRSWKFLAGVGAVVLVVLLVIISVCIAYRRKSRERDDVLKRMKNQMDVLEARVAKECKEAFAELQTDMTEVTSDITRGQGGIPFRDYRCFSMCVLFPAQSAGEHPVVRPLDCDVVHTEALDKSMRQFNQLINHKVFLLLFIRTLEQSESFTVREKVNVASLLSVVLQNRMDYHTDILKTLLAELIEKAMEGKQHPKLLLRRTESVAEKMLTNWFTFLLYKFLRESVGEPLFVLYRAIKQQVDKGPMDAVTGEARYSLSEDKLIRQHVDYKSITLRVLDPEATCAPPQLIPHQQPPVQEFSVKLLDCDTISQAKEKILDAIYRNAPYSSRPHKDDLDLEYRTATGKLKLQDEDITTNAEQGDYKRLNSLAHYRVPENALMALIPRQNPPAYPTTFYNEQRLPPFQRFGSLPSSQSTTSNSIMNSHIENGAKNYHLVKSQESEQHKEGERGSKMVSEVYLTRLLTTKGTLQQFVDDLFETIFSTVYRGSVLPLAIKHMFDFLDDQAIHHGITDPEIVHTWKSNILPLRFWVNVIKNPEFIFDIHKSSIVDACLSVVAQTFMDSCSMSEHKLGKDSPSSKLLYAKDIPKYKKWVERYYEEIKQMPAVSDQDMNATLMEESRSHMNEFNTSAALQELYDYTRRYDRDLMQALDEDEFARKARLRDQLKQIHFNMLQRV